MQKLGSIILFYKPFFLWSFAINILITIFNPQIVTAIGTKLVLVVFLWYFLNNVKGKKLLNFYNKLGVSNFMLFGTVFFIDVFLTMTYLLLIKEFI